MDFQTAVRRAIKQYFDGLEPKDYRKAANTKGKGKRNKKYFDQVEIDLGLKTQDESEPIDNMQEELDEGDA